MYKEEEDDAQLSTLTPPSQQRPKRSIAIQTTPLSMSSSLTEIGKYSYLKQQPKQKQEPPNCKLCEFYINFLQKSYRKSRNLMNKIHPYVIEFKNHLKIYKYKEHYDSYTSCKDADSWLSELEDICYEQFGLRTEPITRIEKIITYTGPPIAISQDDVVGNMVNSHYQQEISQLRQKLCVQDMDNIQYSYGKLTISDQLHYLVTEQSQQKSLTLQCVIYILKKCYCNFFKPNLNYEYIFFNERESQKMTFFSFILSLYKQMAHMAYNFREIFLSFINEHRDNDYYRIITVYNYLYTCYMEVAFSINKKYSELGDHIQNMYSEIVYSDTEHPHFRLITVFVKFWAVIFLVKEVFDSILNSWRVVQRQQPIQYDVLFELVASIIDVSYNQISIHWLGDCQVKNAPNEILLKFTEVYIEETENYYKKVLENLQDSPPQEFYKSLDQDLIVQRRIFPPWFIDCHVEPLMLSYKYKKIQTLMYEKIDALIKNEEDQFLGNSKILKRQPREKLLEVIEISQHIQFIGEQKLQQQKEFGVMGESTHYLEQFLNVKDSQTLDDITAIFLKNSQNMYSELKKNPLFDTHTIVLMATSTNGQYFSSLKQCELIPHYFESNKEGLELAHQIDNELKYQLEQIRIQEDINIARRFQRLESQTLRARYHNIKEDRRAVELNYLRENRPHNDIEFAKAEKTLRASLKEFYNLNIKNLTKIIQDQNQIIKTLTEDDNQLEQKKKQLDEIETERQNLTQYVTQIKD